MSETLVNYVVGATDAQLLALSLEDIALSQAWYASYQGVESIRESCVALPGRVAQWTADKQDAGRSTHGARQQPILRSVLDRLLSFFCLRADRAHLVPKPVSASPGADGAQNGGN